MLCQHTKELLPKSMQNMKYKAERKRQLEADFDKSSERTLVQVLCNGLTGGVAVVAYRYLFESRGDIDCFDQTPLSTALFWAYLG